MKTALRQLFTSLRAPDLNYGRDIIVELASGQVPQECANPVRILDVGCAYGFDLMNVSGALGARCELFGLENDEPKASAARSKGINVFSIDIEREAIPVEDSFFDIVIINQVIEHTKELFWIFSEISRVLKQGGASIVGTANLASLHNRLLLLFGEQPSAIEVLGPHVRGFTVPSFRRFIEADGYFKLLEVRGSNFYPFPPSAARVLSRAFPRLSVGIFFLVRREAREGTFIRVLDTRRYETSYYCGGD